MCISTSSLGDGYLNHGTTGRPGCFEIEIGNRVAFCGWSRLPLSIERLPAAVKRDLNFYGFDRRGHALQEFLQALFVSRGICPFASNNWIREQVGVWLGLPALYCELLSVLEIGCLRHDELIRNAEHAGPLLETWAKT